MQQLAVGKMNPREISVSDYTYTLPQEKIAFYPLERRDESKLLIYRKGNISEGLYKNIVEEIPENSLVIFNDSRVVEARIIFEKRSGGKIEVFALEPADMYPDISTAMHQQEKVFWKCLVGGAGKWKHGVILEKIIYDETGVISVNATIKERLADSFLIELSWQPAQMSFAEILHRAGAIPLPPYIKRDAEPGDAERYQTIYAREEGSVAAPTAGLHFTKHIFEAFHNKNIGIGYVTLHVGAGTFKPVKTPTIGEHDMHAEFIDVSLEVVKKIQSHEKIIAVGTTSLRTLESLYWMGAKLLRNSKLSQEELSISQWEAYENSNDKIVSKKEALNALVATMESNRWDRIITKTQLLVVPDYSFKIIDALITNFHQPQSTLLLIVAALAGRDWKTIYEYALKNDFRFLSYGDGCLIFTAS